MAKTLFIMHPSPPQTQLAHSSLQVSVTENNVGFSKIIFCFPAYKAFLKGKNTNTHAS